MANVIKQLMDRPWRVQYRVILDADTNSGTGLTFIDISALGNFSAGSLLSLAKVFWTTDSPAGGIELVWAGTTPKQAILMLGNGTYGFTAGQPALPADAAGGATLGDLNIVNAAAANATIIVECTKVSDANTGWSG